VPYSRVGGGQPLKAGMETCPTAGLEEASNQTELAEVTGEKAKGSTFTVKLPLVKT